MPCVTLSFILGGYVGEEQNVTLTFCVFQLDMDGTPCSFAPSREPIVTKIPPWIYTIGTCSLPVMIPYDDSDSLSFPGLCTMSSCDDRPLRYKSTTAEELIIIVEAHLPRPCVRRLDFFSANNTTLHIVFTTWLC